MKEKTTIPKRVKGTVLFTVVAVMMVLIVFMTATLALATTANKRAYTNYQQEQLEYNARAVLEAVEKQIDADTTGTGICKDIVSGGTGTIPVSVKLNSESTAYHTVDVNYSKTPQTRWVYELGAWHECEIYRLSVTESSATTSASATCESYIAIQTVSHDADPEEHNDASQPNGAFVSLGDTAGTEIGTHGYTTGGTYLGIGRDSFSYTMSSGGDMTIDAPFYVNGDLLAPTFFTMHFTKPDDFLVVMGDYSSSNTMRTSFVGYSGTDKYDTTPYIYVDGDFSCKTSIDLGEEGHAINFYAGTMHICDNGTPKIYGDIYLMDLGGSSVFGNSGTDTKLYKWTKGNLSRTDEKGTFNTQYGNVYSMGSVQYDGKDQYVGGNVQAKGDLLVTCNPLTVDGDIYVGGTLNVTGNLVCHGNIYAGDIQNSGSITCDGTISSVNATNTGNLNGKTRTEIAGIESTTTSVTVSKGSMYFTALNSDSGSVLYRVTTDGNKYKLEVRGRQHINGTFKDLDGGNPWWNGAYNTLSEGTFDTSVPVETYLEANDEYYRAVKYGSEAAPYDVNITSTLIYCDLDSVVGREVYPSAYTREQLKDNKLEQPKPADYTSVYPTDLRDDRETSSDPDDPPKGIKNQNLFKANQYQVTIYAPGGSASTRYTSVNGVKNADNALASDGLEAGGYYQVKNSCVLTGTYYKNIYIDGSEGKLTVFLDNFHLNGNNGTSIIVDDTHNVTLVVVGGINPSNEWDIQGVELGSPGNGSAIITKSYMDLIKGAGGWNKTDNLKEVMGGMKNDFRVKQYQEESDPEYPNVTIYSDHDSVLSANIGSLITGMVMAPALTFKSNKGTDMNKTLEYELPSGQVVKYGADRSINYAGVSGTKGIGLIGKLVAGSIQINSDGDWGMIYVTTPPPDPDDPGEGEEMSASDETHGSASEITLIRRVYGNSY